jgi:phospholipid/cholesterol/gamma-HCH transport system ATP-binding protein
LRERPGWGTEFMTGAVSEGTKRPIIQVRDLSAGYGGNVILEGISFDVFEGEILVILGESGCGKSTLLKNMIGLDNPYKGHVTIDGDGVSPSDDTAYRRVLQKIGVLYQSGALLTGMTLAENVALPIEAHTGLPKHAVDTLVKIKLSQVHLGEFEDYYPSELSGGMRKRAGLARAMALNPKILFFDEPSAGLDPVSSAELDHLIIQLNKSLGTTMVIVTHELQSIFAVAERVIMLDKRSRGITAEGDPRYLRDRSENPYVRRFFNRWTEQETGGSKDI